tara:strand:+ start:1334 stop:1510 length:177 start_codon:yes stop_codon:yes gene_type:complete
MKKNNLISDNSKRKFNIFFIINMISFSIFGRLEKRKKIKNDNKINNKDYIWFLNENDK